MRSGLLNRRVTIQKLAVGQDAIGQPVTTWTDLATVWASVVYLQGLETIKGDADTSVKKASIRIRRRTDVTAAMRVLLGATVFEIKAALPDEQDRERTDLACEVVT